MGPTKAVGSTFILAAGQLRSATNSPKYYVKNIFLKNKIIKKVEIIFIGCHYIFTGMFLDITFMVTYQCRYCKTHFIGIKTESQEVTSPQVP